MVDSIAAMALNRFPESQGSMQIGASFDLTLAECEAILLGLVEECRIAEDEGSASRVHRLLSQNVELSVGATISCEWDLVACYSLLNRLLVACPVLAINCGMYRSEMTMRHAVWESKSTESSALESACKSILEGMGFAFPL